MVEVVDNGELNKSVAVPTGLEAAFTKLRPNVEDTETLPPLVVREAVPESGTEMVREPGLFPEPIFMLDAPEMLSPACSSNSGVVR